MAIRLSPQGPGFFLFFQTKRGGNEKGNRPSEYGGESLFTKRYPLEEDEIIALTLMIARSKHSLTF